MTNDQTKGASRVTDEQMRVVAKLYYMFGNRQEVIQILRIHVDTDGRVKEEDIQFLNEATTLTAQLREVFDNKDKDGATVDYYDFMSVAFGMLSELEVLADDVHSRNDVAISSSDLSQLMRLVSSYPSLLAARYDKLVSRMRFAPEGSETP